MGLLARVGEDVPNFMLGMWGCDARYDGRRRLGKPGVPRRVELAVRNANRFFPALTPVVAVMLPMFVAVEVGVESLDRMRPFLLPAVQIRIACAASMEMSERSESREEEERRDLNAANRDSTKGKAHGHHFLRSPG